MMSEWPSIKATMLNKEKDSIYLTLVDMFVEVVEPSIIQMVLQNRNWDLDAAIEDIMVLSSTTCEKPLNIQSTGTSENNIKVSKTIHHFDNFEATNFVNDDDSTSVTSSSTLQSTNKASVKEEIRAVKKTPLPDSNQSVVKDFSDKTETSEIDLSEFANSYNYVKAVPVSYERSVLLVRNGVRLMIILRGPPGSGKSYLAKKLLSEAGIDPPRHKNHVFSSDDFFIQNNVYVFDPNLLSQAHIFNQRNVLTATRNHVSPIIVDNTNTQAWEMRVYADLAVSAGYDLEIIEPSNWWLFKESELSKRNVHGVPKAKIRNMIERYEKHITPKKLMQQFELQYSLNNAPPQPVPNTKWKDKLRSFKSNKHKKKKQDMYPRPQTHSSKGNLKNMMPTITFKPHEFLDNPQLQTTLPFPSPSLPSSSTYNCTSVSNSLVQKSYSPQTINKVNGSAGFDFSMNLFSNGKMMPESQTSINANEQVFNRRNIPVISMENAFQAYSPPELGGTHNRGSPSNIKEDDSNDDSKCFESHKLLSFNKSLSKNPNMVLENAMLVHNNNETLPVTFGSDMKVRSCKALSPKDGMSNAAETKEAGHVSALCQTKFKVEHLGNMDDKESVANKLMNSLLDTAVATERKNKISHKEPNEVDSNTDVMDKLGSLWDYVLVGSNNKFIYKNLNSIPISSTVFDSNSAISKPNFDQLTSGHLSNQKHKGNLKTDFHKGEIQNYSESSKSEGSEYLVQENFDTSKEPSALSTFSLHSILKENEVSSNIDTSKQNCKTFSSELIESNCKGINIKDLKVIKDCQEHISKKDEDVHATIDLEKADTQVGEYSTQIHSEKKTEAMGIMKNILSSTCSQKPSCSLEKDMRINCRENNGSHVLVNYSPDDWSKESLQKVSNTFVKNYPETVPKLTRSSVSTNDVKVILHQQNKDYSNFGTWDTVTNAVESWDHRESENNYELPKERPLPQRLTSNKHLKDSSTNTSYHDFSAEGHHNIAEAKVLIGSCREIAIGCHKSTFDISQTLLLDKSTMTIEDTSESENKLDLSQINILFPHIPESYILDMVEKCQGDIDWAVDLLLDSEHSIYHVHNGSNESTSASIYINHDVSGNNVFKVNDHFKKLQNTKFVVKTPNTTNENFELKKAIESSVVLNKSHYSDQVLKVLKKKNPEYLSLIESKDIENDECLKHSDQLPTLVHEIIPEKQLETHSSDAENISNFPIERQDDDDNLELIVNYDLVLQLQQKFGNSSTPKIMNMTPLVKLPVSLARQLYGYMMDSIQTEVDEQQDAIESMIAKDEEIAKMLQYQDQNLKPKLQEIMDMEVALAMHKADQEEWNERSNNTVAAKLSKNILLEKFPHVDPKMLMDMLQAHNYSLHDTVNSLKLALEVGDDSIQELKECNTAASLASLDQNKDARGSYTVASDSVDPLNEAHSHRQEAANYYAMRMECLRKAQEAYRAGNKPVASYYSQLAQLHKQKVEQCNSAAASCLLSNHKTGNTLDLHFLHITEAEVVLDMFLDEIINYISDKRKRFQTVFLITGRGLRSVGGVSRIKPMAIRKLQSRKVLYNEVNPGMLSALIRIDTPLSYT